MGHTARFLCLALPLALTFSSATLADLPLPTPRRDSSQLVWTMWLHGAGNEFRSYTIPIGAGPIAVQTRWQCVYEHRRESRKLAPPPNRLRNKVLTSYMTESVSVDCRFGEAVAQFVVFCPDVVRSDPDDGPLSSGSMSIGEAHNSPPFTDIEVECWRGPVRDPPPELPRTRATTQ
jgi:hypothetical protein